MDDTAVTERFLHHQDIVVSGIQRCGECMPEFMRCNRFVDSGEPYPLRHKDLNAPGNQATTLLVDEKCVAVGISHELRTLPLDVFVNRCSGCRWQKFPNRTAALLVPDEQMLSVDIIDVEYPASALGTPYPLNILAVSEALRSERLKRLIVTNIGEKQLGRSSACQAALGVAAAGVDAVKCGLAELELRQAIYLGQNIVRTIKHWYPKKQVIPAVFADKDLVEILDPMTDAGSNGNLAANSRAQFRTVSLSSKKSKDCSPSPTNFSTAAYRISFFPSGGSESMSSSPVLRLFIER